MQDEETFRNTQEHMNKILLEQDKLKMETEMLNNQNEMLKNQNKMLRKQMRNLIVEFDVATLKRVQVSLKLTL